MESIHLFIQYINHFTESYIYLIPTLLIAIFYTQGIPERNKRVKLFLLMFIPTAAGQTLILRFFEIPDINIAAASTLTAAISYYRKENMPYICPIPFWLIYSDAILISLLAAIPEIEQIHTHLKFFVILPLYLYSLLQYLLWTLSVRSIHLAGVFLEADMRWPNITEGKSPSFFYTAIANVILTMTFLWTILWLTKYEYYFYISILTIVTVSIMYFTWCLIKEKPFREKEYLYETCLAGLIGVTMSLFFKFMNNDFFQHKDLFCSFLKATPSIFFLLNPLFKVSDLILQFPEKIYKRMLLQSNILIQGIRIALNFNHKNISQKWIGSIQTNITGAIFALVLAAPHAETILSSLSVDSVLGQTNAEIQLFIAKHLLSSSVSTDAPWGVLNMLFENQGLGLVAFVWIMIILQKTLEDIKFKTNDKVVDSALFLFKLFYSLFMMPLFIMAIMLIHFCASFFLGNAASIILSAALFTRTFPIVNSIFITPLILISLSIFMTFKKTKTGQLKKTQN